MHNTMAPNVISNPAVRTETSRSDDSSISIPAGASTEQPVTMFPNISAVGAKRRPGEDPSSGFFMQLHVEQTGSERKARPVYFERPRYSKGVRQCCRATSIFSQGLDCAARIPC